MYFRDMQVGKTYSMGEGHRATVFTVHAIRRNEWGPSTVETTDRCIFSRPGFTVVKPL